MSKIKNIEVSDDLCDEMEDAGTNTASFLISDGRRDLMVKAKHDCWAICEWIDSIDPRTDKAKGWVPFKYVVDLGMVAGRLFEWRLKNSYATTLTELSEMAKQVRIDIRKEFTL